MRKLSIAAGIIAVALLCLLSPVALARNKGPKNGRISNSEVRKQFRQLDELVKNLKDAHDALPKWEKECFSVGSAANSTAITAFLTVIKRESGDRLTEAGEWQPYITWLDSIVTRAANYPPRDKHRLRSAASALQISAANSVADLKLMSEIEEEDGHFQCGGDPPKPEEEKTIFKRLNGQGY